MMSIYRGLYYITTNGGFNSKYCHTIKSFKIFGKRFYIMQRFKYKNECRLINYKKIMYLHKYVNIYLQYYGDGPDFGDLVSLKKDTPLYFEGPKFYLICKSKQDDSYIGTPNEVYVLIKKFKIERFYKSRIDHKVASIGFNPIEKIWYGWSHRAIYGFTIGSKIKKGNCGYRPSNIDELIESEKRWHENIMEHENIEITINEETNIMIIKSSSKKSDISSIQEINLDDFPYGKGEWEAKSLLDAKQMAIDFADSVS